MYCPNPECTDLIESGVRGEYVEGITVCPTCGAALVNEEELEIEQPPELVEDDVEVETVFVSADTSEMTVVRSMLEGAGIPYILNAGADQEFLGLGQAGIGFGRRGGPCLRVRLKDVETVKALLEGVENIEVGPVPEATPGPE